MCQMCWKKYIFCWCCCSCRNKNNDGKGEAMYMDIAKPYLKQPASSVVVRALYDYDTAWCPDGDIQFKKDECFELLDSGGDWYLVKTPEGIKGRVPSNYVELDHDKKWYFEDVNSRLEAEIMLSHKQNPKNAFLVRRAHRIKRYHAYSLSVLRDENIFHHFKICSNGRTFYMKHGYMNVHYITLTKLVQDCTDKGYIGAPCIRDTLPPSINMSEFGEDDLIDYSTIRLTKTLGQGRSGQVYQGHWNQNVVAIKVIKDAIELNALKKEAAILKKCIHKNIVNMYGICVTDTIMIVQEYMTDGSLKEVMSKGPFNLNYRTLQYIGYQVACGMVYLEKRNYIHCDLAARNILISCEHDPLTVKIADFGMAKCLAAPTYVSANEYIMPIRWSAPEVLSHSKLSIKSDVWSYGIFLMELFTHCRIPYNNFSSNQEVIQKVTKGYKMKYPSGFNILRGDFSMMLKCWEFKPKNRPTFKSLKDYYESEGSNQY